MNTNLKLFVCAATLALVAGCAGQEIEVKGETTAPAGVSGPITLEFFEVGDDAESIQTVEIAEIGAFTQTVEVDGESVKIVALADADKNGACTEGEAWAESTLAISEEGTVDAVTLALTVKACPVAPAAE